MLNLRNNKNLIAAGLALLASAILSFSDNFVAPVAEEAGLWQFQVVRAIFALPILIGVAKMLGIPIKPKRLGRVFIRSAAVSAGLLIYFATLGFLPVAQAGAGLFSAPIWVASISIAVLGKRVGKKRMVALGFGFAGVLMLLQPDISTLSLLSLLPLLAGVLYGFGSLLTNYMCRTESAFALAIGLFGLMGCASLAFLIYFTAHPVGTENVQFYTHGWRPLTWRFLLLTFGQAIASSVAVTVIAQAYKTGDPAFISVCEYSFLVFAAIWTYFLWGNVTDTLAIIGIGIILLAGFSMFILDKKATTSPKLAPKAKK